MNVDAFAVRISCIKLILVNCGFYTNSWGQRGYFAVYRIDGECFIKYSVSATEIPIQPDEVAVAIRAPGSRIQRAKPYLNRKGQQGFEATVLSGGHAFMLNAAPHMPRRRGLAG